GTSRCHEYVQRIGGGNTGIFQDGETQWAGNRLGNGNGIGTALDVLRVINRQGYLTGGESNLRCLPVGIAVRIDDCEYLRTGKATANSHGDPVSRRVRANKSEGGSGRRARI